MVRSFALCLFVGTCILSSEAQAQSDADVAAAVVARAQEAYDAGDFTRAAVLLEESLHLFEAPAIHYNLARTLSELSRWEEARTHFQRFLELAPDAPQRPAVESRIAELDRRIARDAGVVEPEQPPVVQPAPVEPPAPEPVPTVVAKPSLNTAPWGLIGAGVLVAAVAIPMGSASSTAEERASQSATHREGAEELDTARRYARVANTMLVVGGVMAVAGIIWAIAKPRRSEAVSFDGTSVRVRF